MGCWNETCALSGLPIVGGDDCVRLRFDDANLIAFCGEENFIKHITQFEKGKYDEYGRIEGNKQDHEDGDVFFLKYFWDKAIQDFDNSDGWHLDYFNKDIKEVVDHDIQYHEDIIKFTDQPAMTNTLKELRDCCVPKCYREYGEEIFVEIKKIIFTMVYLRRTFYTAAHRGSQVGEFGKHLSMAKEIVKYCERKLKKNEFENNIDDQNNSIEIVLPEEPKFKTYSEWSDWFFNQNPDLYNRYYDVTKYEEKS